MEEIQGLEAVLANLVAEEVDFLLVGGWAAVLHGSAHQTQDIGICFRKNRENCRKIVKALRPLRPRLRDLPSGLPFVWDEQTLMNGTNFTLMTSVGAVDLFAELSGLGGYEQLAGKALRVRLKQGQVEVIDLRSLILSKRSAGRPKDLLQLPELEALLEAEEEK